LTGEATSNNYGVALATSDLNADGTDDLIVGATGYNTNQGRLYFYTTNDYQLTGAASSDSLGSALAIGDFNADGKNDLAVGASGYNSSQGRTYIFYGGSLKTETTAGADITLTGGATGDTFGYSLTTGDFNADGKDDLAVGAYAYSTSQGRVYIFYGGSMISEGAAGADITLTGGSNRYFGKSLTSGDYDGNGVIDIAVGEASGAWTRGNVLIFYGGSMVSEDVSGADITISGVTQNYYFGEDLATGDFNADGRDDLVVSAPFALTNQGKVYIYFGGSIISEGSSGADIVLDGEVVSSYFGASFTTGDYNADGKDDLAVGAYGYNSNQGRAYIFYGGSMASENASGADVTLTGEATGNYFGSSITAGDWNSDGKDDLAVGAYGYNSSQGRIYLFYGRNLRTVSATHADVIITGQVTNSNFGNALVVGDLSGNGVDDLIIGANGYDVSSDEGRVYILSSEAATQQLSQYRLQGTVKMQGTVKFQ
jgi:hypothetical protein